MLQNLLYLQKKKTHVVFFRFSFRATFIFPIDQGIHKGKLKVALNEKRKKLRGLSFSINIRNIEAFLQRIKLTKNLFFAKSVCFTFYFYLFPGGALYLGFSLPALIASWTIGNQASVSTTNLPPDVLLGFLRTQDKTKIILFIIPQHFTWCWIIIKVKRARHGGP